MSFPTMSRQRTGFSVHSVYVDVVVVAGDGRATTSCRVFFTRASDVFSEFKAACKKHLFEIGVNRTTRKNDLSLRFGGVSGSRVGPNRLPFRDCEIRWCRQFRWGRSDRDAHQGSFYTPRDVIVFFRTADDIRPLSAAILGGVIVVTAPPPDTLLPLARTSGFYGFFPPYFPVRPSGRRLVRVSFPRSRRLAWFSSNRRNAMHSTA